MNGWSDEGRKERKKEERRFKKYKLNFTYQGNEL